MELPTCSTWELIFKTWKIEVRKLVYPNSNFKVNCDISLLINLFISLIELKRRTFESETICDNWKPFKNDEKCRSHDIEIFVLTFWSSKKAAGLERSAQFQNLLCHNLVNKQLNTHIAQYLKK